MKTKNIKKQENNTNKIAEINIAGIRETEYSISEPSITELEEIQGLPISISVLINLGWTIEKDQFGIFFYFEFIHPKIEGKVFCKIRIVNEFIIKDIKDHLHISEEDKTKFNMDDALLKILIEIAINQSRGFLACRFRGSFLNHILLPLASPDDFLHQLHKLVITKNPPI